MDTIMKKRLTLAAMVASAACSVSYSLAAADAMDTTPRQVGSDVKHAAGSAARFAGDVAITTTVKTKLVADEITKARDIKVITENGVVQLIGQVDSPAEMREAESVAQSVDGVKAVKNDLTLKTP